MNDIDLLDSFMTKRVAKQRAASKVNLEDDINDITFLMHWFPQFTMEELLEMNLRPFNALLKSGKADYYEAHLQNLEGQAALQSGKKGALKDYAQSIQKEIKRLRD